MCCGATRQHTSMIVPQPVARKQRSRYCSTPLFFLGLLVGLRLFWSAKETTKQRDLRILGSPDRKPASPFVGRRLTNPAAFGRPETPQRNEILVWKPNPNCRGTFMTPARTLIIHDVAVDWRHASQAILDAKNAEAAKVLPSRRLNAVLTVATGTITAFDFKDKATRGLKGKNRPTAFLSGKSLRKGWRAHVDHVFQDKEGFWYISITVSGPASLISESDFQKELDGMIQRQGARSILVELRLPIVLLPGNVHPGSRLPGIRQEKLSFSLSCVTGISATGLNSNQMLSNLLPKMPPSKKCGEASGSVLVAGSPLRGFKRDDEMGRREVANFIARAINGPIRFDTVAVPVIISITISNIESLCGRNAKCAERHHKRNENILSSLASDVGKELVALRVPNSEWDRVAIFPVCTLGNDFDGAEKGNYPCSSITVSNGPGAQIMVQDFAYTLFSPFHKWFAFMDVDEFLVDEKQYLAPRSTFADRQVAPESAFTLFERRTAAYRNDTYYTWKRWPLNSIMVPWLDFAILDDQHRSITRRYAERGGLDFVSNRAYRLSTGTNVTKADRKSCSIRHGWYGKNIVSCDKGILGIRYHAVTRLRDPLDFGTRFSHENFMDYDLRVYHARARPARGPRFGDCLWLPEGTEKRRPVSN